MRIHHYILSLVLILLLFNGCVKGPRCWGEDKYKGIIVDHIDCPPIGLENELIIEDDVTYRTTFISSIDSTPLFDIPDIDFSKYTLLGATLSTGGTYGPRLICEVTNDSENKKYIFKANLRQCGWGKKLCTKEVLVIVPKLPEEFSVVFDLKDQ